MPVLSPKLIIGIAVACVLAFTHWLAWDYGHTGEANANLKAQAAQQEQYTKDLTAAVDAARKEEQLKATQAVAATRKLLEANNATKINATTALASPNGLWADAQCITPYYRIVPTTADASRDCSTTPIQLSVESAKFFIEQAAEADRNTNQLTAAQELLELDRQSSKPE